MVTFKTNKNNDIELNGRGDIALATDLEACIETCRSAVSTMLNEQIYNIDEGVPNFQALWGGSPNFQQAEIAIRNTLENVENVESVVSFEFERDGSEFRYNAIIKTVFGVGRLYNGL